MDVAIISAIAGIAGATIVLGFVAAAETALERASEVRIQRLAAKKNPRAMRIASKVQEPRALLEPLTPARVLAAALVVALAAFVGAREFSPVVGALGLGMAAGVFVAFVEITVGLIAAKQPESAAMALGGVVRQSSLIFGVPALLVGLPARLAARSITAVTRDDSDLLDLVEREEASGGVEEEEKRMIRGIISLEDKMAREIMVPRIDVAAADIDDSLADVARLVTERGYSRIPVYQGQIDEIVGVVHAKDLLRLVTNGGRERKLKDVMRDPFFIPESKRLDELLAEMRLRRAHLAIVVDEYGGTAGIVTIEDLIEEIVGEIEDEYDVTAPRIEVLSPDEALVSGGAPTETLKDLFGFELDSEDYDTVGGFVMHRLGRLPSVGDEVEAGGLRLRVVSMLGRRVGRLRIEREHEGDEDSDEDGQDVSRSA